MEFVLGIDGGGSKTTCAIATRDGVIVATANSGPTNLLRRSEDEVRRSLHAAIDEACAAANCTLAQIKAASIGIGGASRENVSERIREIAGELLQCPMEIVGDMVIAHDAALRGGPGVIVIAGTGSIAYGRNEQGETARAGGWGSVISDEGSGYWIGRGAVAAAFRALDKGRATSLISHIMSTWKLVTRDDLIAAANANPQPNFAELVPAVFEAATEGDVTAQELLTDAAVELAKVTKILIRRLWPEPHPLQVVVLGGIFLNSQLIQKVFDNALRSERPDATVRLLNVAPVEGAVLRATQLYSTNSAVNR